MSIYFQFPAIEDYPIVVYPVSSDANNVEQDDQVLNLTEDEKITLQNYLTLKQV